MANLPLAFAEAGVGAMLLVAGISGSTFGEVIRGTVSMHPLVEGDAPGGGGGSPAPGGGGSPGGGGVGITGKGPTGSTATGSGTPTAGTGGTRADQVNFGNYLAKYTGLDPQFVQAWLLHEQGPGSPSYTGSNNWLNVGAVSSNPSDWTAQYWEIAVLGPQAAAKMTAEWLKVNQPSILAAVGQGPEAQVTALENSGWAAGHYNYESPAAFLG